MAFNGTNILCHLVYACCMCMLCKCQGGFIGVNIGNVRRSVNDKTSIDVTCPDDHVISDLEILAGKTAKDNTFCTGNTASLKSATNNCYWNQSCEIEFPRGRLITCHTGECSRCLWKTPEFFRVTRAKCVPKKEVTSTIPMVKLTRNRRATEEDLKKGEKKRRKRKKGGRKGNKSRKNKGKGKKRCSKADAKKGKCIRKKKNKKQKGKHETTTQKMTANNDVSKFPNLPTNVQEQSSGIATNIDIIQTDKGVIKSHPDYPWFYRKSENASTYSLRYDGNTHSAQCVSLEIRIRHICELDNLIITPNEAPGKNFSLINDKETDQFGYIVYNTTENIANGHITFTFERGAESPGCEGFIICYKGSSDCSQATGSICDMVENTTATVTLKVRGDTYDNPCCPNDGSIKAGHCYFNDQCM